MTVDQKMLLSIPTVTIAVVSIGCCIYVCSAIIKAGYIPFLMYCCCIGSGKLKCNCCGKCICKCYCCRRNNDDILLSSSNVFGQMIKMKIIANGTQGTMDASKQYD